MERLFIPAAAVAAVIALMFLLRDYKKVKRSAWERFLYISFLIYLVAIAHLTLGYFHLPPEENAPMRIQLEPLYFIDEWQTYEDFYSSSFFNNARLTFFNFIMLMPLGVYLAVLFQMKPFWKAFFMIFTVSLTIELSQLVLSYVGIAWMRGFNTDDLIVNTAGGFLAYLIARIFRGLIRLLGK
ncbi:VanZ family protein [Jeotgalibacillus sp. R-1-5s-1]|uniref:VanZ family protein n=1 Tax=Jeotgalibacillus sp. R-1-5s-1 TaxID=2555897 RepID=UPI001FC88ACF|nr:VanZ family protein [Jeotgalibacillus sp. R-1-5s-1]